MTIYFDNAATSFPKPEPVCEAVAHAIRHAAANPGRGGYRLSLEAGRIVLAAREAAARLIGLPDPARVIFNPGSESEELEAALRAHHIESLHACTLVMLRTRQF